MERFIIHADMDAFFASVTQLLHPQYRGQPVIVGGPGERGVVCAASYEARKFGVHSAMPLWKARQLCPRGHFLPVEGAACQDFSRRALEIYQRYTPRFIPLSIDEVCLDVTGSQKLFGPPLHIAREIQETIRRELGLSVSIGLGPNPLVAKMASEWQKPCGLTRITSEQLPGIFAPLPVNKLWGLGPVTAQRLQRLGVNTIGQLQRISLLLLEREFGVTGRHLYAAARGLDDSQVPLYDGKREYKQMSEERTLARDTRDVELLSLTLLGICDHLGWRLRREGYQSRQVTLKIRLDDFQNMTRTVTLPAPTDVDYTLFQTADRLLRSQRFVGRRVRLIGVAVSGLVEEGAAVQLSLFSEDPSRQRQLNRARDEIKARFGHQALARAKLLAS